jgi:hypothetical protein
VNFVGHIAVGRAVHHGVGEPDPSFLLGTALPDFAAMARVRLAPADGALGDGMAVHHETDAVFHRARWFLDSEHDLLDDLTAAGLPRGPALACAHVGVELLLDGELVRDRAVAGAVRAVYALMAAPPAAAVAVAPDTQRAHWVETHAGIARRLDPEGYADPETVAVRLQRATSRRPRLAFSPALVPTVAERLAAHQPQVAARAPQVLADVRDALGAGAAMPALGNT